MTLFSRCDTPPAFGRSALSRRRLDVRRGGDVQSHPLLGFFEEVGILVRYAIGRDYYDRGALVPKE